MKTAFMIGLIVALSVGMSQAQGQRPQSYDSVPGETQETTPVRGPAVNPSNSAGTGNSGTSTPSPNQGALPGNAGINGQAGAHGTAPSGSQNTTGGVNGVGGR